MSKTDANLALGIFSAAAVLAGPNHGHDRDRRVRRWAPCQLEDATHAARDTAGRVESII